MFPRINLIFDEQYFMACLDLVKAARSEILLSSFVVNLQAYRKTTKSQALLESLKESALRGVDIKVLLNRFRPQMKVSKLNTIVAKYLNSSKIDVRYLADNRCSHAKFICIDSKYLILGSHNWTRKALERNFEVSLSLDDEKIVLELRAWFLRLFNAAQKFID